MEIYKLICNDSEVLTDVLCMYIAYTVEQVYQHVVSLTPCLVQTVNQVQHVEDEVIFCSPLCMLLCMCQLYCFSYVTVIILIETRRNLLPQHLTNSISIQFKLGLLGYQL